MGFQIQNGFIGLSTSVQREPHEAHGKNFDGTKVQKPMQNRNFFREKEHERLFQVEQQQCSAEDEDAEREDMSGVGRGQQEEQDQRAQKDD